MTQFYLICLICLFLYIANKPNQTKTQPVFIILIKKDFIVRKKAYLCKKLETIN